MRFISGSLNMKILVTVFLAVFLIQGAGGLLAYRSLQQREENRFHESKRILLAHLRESLADAINNFDKDSAVRLMDFQFALYPDLRLVAAYQSGNEESPFVARTRNGKETADAQPQPLQKLEESDKRGGASTTEVEYKREKIGKLCVVLGDGQLQTALRDKVRETVVTTLLTELILAGFIYLLLRRIVTRPLLRTVADMQVISAGDLNQKLNVEALQKRGDELGQLAQALQKVRENFARKSAFAEALAGGDLGSTVELSSQKDMLGLALQNMAAILRRTIREISESAVNVKSEARQITTAMQTLSVSATSQAASLQDIAGRMESMAQTTTDNASGARHARELSEEVRGTAAAGSRDMDGLTAAMREIESSSAEITKVIKVIDDIAFQTNLLALNAAVEAARAQRYGKGFAVVAEEVRNLAARSAKAARETADMIQSSSQRVEHGSRIAAKTAETFGRIVKGLAGVGESIDDIAAASQEQEKSILEIKQNVGRVDDLTQENTASAEEVSAASAELSGQADQLAALLSFFQNAEHSSCEESAFHEAEPRAFGEEMTAGIPVQPVRRRLAAPADL